jgi:hypothetical protein
VRGVRYVPAMREQIYRRTTHDVSFHDGAPPAVDVLRVTIGGRESYAFIPMHLQEELLDYLPEARYTVTVTGIRHGSRGVGLFDTASMRSGPSRTSPRHSVSTCSVLLLFEPRP